MLNRRKFMVMASVAMASVTSVASVVAPRYPRWRWNTEYEELTSCRVGQGEKQCRYYDDERGCLKLSTLLNN